MSYTHTCEHVHNLNMDVIMSSHKGQIYILYMLVCNKYFQEVNDQKISYSNENILRGVHMLNNICKKSIFSLGLENIQNRYIISYMPVVNPELWCLQSLYE